MHHQPRHSLYPPSSAAQQSSILASLQSCVASAQNCVDRLDDSIEVLSHATDDFPRLKVVLSNRRHYDLLSERDIHSARSHISAEVQPHIDQLVSLATAEIDRLERKARALNNKKSTYESRLESYAVIEKEEVASKRRADALIEPGAAGGVDANAELKQTLRREQERLEQTRRRRIALMRKVEQLEAGMLLGDDAELGEEEEEEL
ncbi:DASH complex subunit spc19 [Thecaphora frezii]